MTDYPDDEPTKAFTDEELADDEATRERVLPEARGGAPLGTGEGVVAVLAPGATLRTLFTPSKVWLYALVLLVGEAGCSAFVRPPSAQVTDELYVDEEGRLHDEVGDTGITLGRYDLEVRGGVVALVDGIVRISGQRTASPAEVVGGVLGGWVSGLLVAPFLIGVIGALVRPRYYHRLLARLLAQPPPPGKLWPTDAEFRGVFGTWFWSSALELVALAAGALPGFVLLIVGGLTGIPILAGLAMFFWIGGGFAGWLWARLGFLYADRFVVYRGLGFRDALRASWKDANRGDRVVPWLAYAVTDSLGMLFWFAGPLGLLLHPPLRVSADAFLSRAFFGGVGMGDRVVSAPVPTR